MKNVEKLEELLEPYYEQFEKLGDMWEDQLLSWSFLKRARKRFGKQYFYELRLFFGAENRILRHDCRMAKHKDKKLFARVWKSVCKKERAQRKQEKEKCKIQRKLERERQKREKKEQRRARATRRKSRKRGLKRQKKDKT